MATTSIPGPARRAVPADTPRIRFEPNDPLEPGQPVELVTAPRPAMDSPRTVVLPEDGPMPPPAPYDPSGAPFRDWQLAEALHRGVRLWRELVPGFVSWQDGRAELPALPDEGEDLNAFYDRRALNFFHARDVVRRETVYSGRSVDVACHEEGHAVLDALRPELWDAALFEVAAFHEAFGDISALLVALEDPVLCEKLLADTAGDPSASNDISRLAEELGRAVRDDYGPWTAPSDCLRNAVNDFVYVNPRRLSPSGPDRVLTREPHSFSRVFTGAFYEALTETARAAVAGMPLGSELLRSTARTLGASLATAAQAAPLSSRWYGQVAAAWVEAAGGGQSIRDETATRAEAACEVGTTREVAGQASAEVLRAVLVRRNLLPEAVPSGHSAGATGLAGSSRQRGGLTEVAVTITLGLAGARGTVICLAAPPASRAEACLFLEDLLARRHVTVANRAAQGKKAGRAALHATHRLDSLAGGSHELRRIRFRRK